MMRRQRQSVSVAAAVVALAACSGSGHPDATSPGVGLEDDRLGVRIGALEGGPRTVPYGGYVDFDGEPVNAASVGFNFALFPCATPGTGASGCGALWVAKGAWNNTADWTQGWPTGAGDTIGLPVFSGRFSVELGAAGQAPLPDVVFEAGHEVLYLGIRIEGRPLAGLQKVVPSARTRVAERAYLAESALVADMVGELTPEDIATRRSWAASGEVAPGASLEVQTFGDASSAQVLVWERRGATWVSIDPTMSFLDDPTLQAYYPFDEVAGATLSDHSDNGRHLTIDGSVQLAQPGVIGTSIAFPTDGGVASSSSFGLVLSQGSGLTFSFWVLPTQFNGDDYVLLLYRDNATRDYQFHYYSCGTYRLRFDSLTGRAGTTCPAQGAPSNVWTHVVMTVEPARHVTRYYVNGVLDPDGILTTTLVGAEATMNYLRLGNYAYGSPQTFFVGRLDELAIFDRALSPEEITTIYRHGIANQSYALAKGADGRVTLTNNSATARTLRMLVVK